MTAALSMIVTGGVLLMAALRNRPVLDILRGVTSPLPGFVGSEQQAATTQLVSSGAGGLGSVKGQGGSADANRALGHRMMRAAGWSEDQWRCLDLLWTQESGWLPKVNPQSGAAGIPQALGHGHVFDLDDIPAQIRWGLNYIRGRYGSPCAAWAHEQANGWY